MALEAMEKILEIEEKSREEKRSAEADARRMIADAEQGGVSLIQQVRAQAAEAGKMLMQQAEAHAAEQATAIAQAAEAEGDALRQAAEMRLEEVAEFIIGRVVMQ